MVSRDAMGQLLMDEQQKPMKAPRSKLRGINPQNP